MTTNFHIYNASAGSGKTFTLTSRVLVKIIKSKEEDAFKGILALTFTNKAADEMKTRILTGLQEFTDLKNINQPSELFKQVKKEVGLGSKEICNISKRRLSLLLHNFSFFQVSTLDSFNHNIIRAFSKELNLVSDFKVIIDSEDFINEAVERLLAQTGEEKKTSNALIDFANKKIKEGKTWDISFDLRELAKTLTNENHYIHIKKLESRTSEDFINEKNEINKRLAALNLEKIALTKQMEMIINSEEKEIIFSRNSFPKFLIKLKNKKWTLANITTISNYFENRTLITKKCLTENPENAEKVFKSLYEGFKKIKDVLFDVTMAKAFSLAITPASVLSLIKKTSKEMQDERGELLLSEFNQRICEEIKDHPAPYIYEKIGTKFKDYMIDEFQDTSFLQWSNLIPLISHSLESEEMAGKQGSLLLVGDPKQSVYRWRAADPNIFISLLLKANPFNVAKSNKTLPKNFRSNKEIVKFNNGFFQHLSEIMESPINKQIYQLGVEQKIDKKEDGHVSIEFVKKNLEKEFLEKTLLKITSCKTRGFAYLDLGVLVRTRVQASILAAYLISKNIPIISSETLLLQSSSKVKLLIELIRLRITPTNKLSRKTVINFLIEKSNPEDPYLFFESLIKEPIFKFFERLGVMSFQDFINTPLLKSIDLLILKLSLDYNNNDGFVQFFKEELLVFVLKNGTDERGFLEYWEKNKEKLSVAMSEGQDAVTILTVHKAKGLEFPVVIYPFADSPTFKSFSKKVWLPVHEKKNSLELLVPFSSAIENFGESAEKIFRETRTQQELDNTNILYVALTRAIEELHVVSSYPKNKSISSHNEMFRSYLESQNTWNDKQTYYSWGKEKQKEANPLPQSNTLSKSYKRSRYKFDGKAPYQDQKILFGKIFHKLMAKIKYSYQFDKEIMAFRKARPIKGINKEEIIDLAQKTITHPSLSRLFTTKNKVICEKEIFVNQSQIIRPDRIIMTELKSCIVLDYKTGEKNVKDIKQTVAYTHVLRKMGFTIEKALIVYFSPQIDVVEAT